MDSMFEMIEGYDPSDKDLVLLLHLDAETPCYDTERLPAALANCPAPEDAGGKRWCHAAAIDGAFIAAMSVRLDGADYPSSENLKQAVVKALATAKEEKLARLCIPLDNSFPGAESLAKAIQEGAILGGYAFDSFLSKKAEPLKCVLCLQAPPTADLEKIIAETGTVTAAVNQARDLCNEPPNSLYPESMAQKLKTMAEQAGMSVSIWDTDKLEQERCGGILAVGRGSSQKPRLVVAEYQPKDATSCCTLTLVGKGVTFDTGGYSLKPSESQVGMKYDMAGAATVFAAASAIASLGLPLTIKAYAPLVENNVSSNAYKVNDIVTTRSGTTVEILNTDAEGRMLLADALALASEEKPDYLVDVATLTGAAVVGLGEDIAAVYGTDASLTAQMLEASSETGEFFWEMPLYAPYAEKLKATVADVNNTGKTRMGGSIVAALFLKKWINEGQKWLHLDVAGPGGKEDTLGPIGKGGKGFGVRTLVALAKILSQA